MAATLYVVATPIGHLGDITVRAVDTLRAADRIVAEDTRRTRSLLSHLGIERKPLTSLEAHASPEEIERAVSWLCEGSTIAFVTDAGMPGVSDPGAAFVTAALAAGIAVVPIPGPSAVTAAVAASGLVTGGFRFFGFLPRAGAARADALTTLLATPEAVVLFESPQRLSETMRELSALCPERPAVIAREMTKMHEEFLRGRVGELAAEPREWLGEITIVLGPDASAQAAPKIGESDIDRRIEEELARGEGSKGIAQRVAAWSGRSRREIYERVLAAKGKGAG
ncbi:MAG TPA: 16S rRNA (cytidine(1402)-2'-O)-methyltransferase [Polyangiaceae bacterium]|nr:16S rRNA (cytidine(1402)-2'-O)-methyltransferase [Polyangiaceae bacterium]